LVEVRVRDIIALLEGEGTDDDVTRVLNERG